MTNPDNRTYAQRVEDDLEDAWQRGEISYAEACAELEDLGDRP
ncbi:hypothetical protein [Mycobacterium hackensackense]|nr:hypothetical protein [Mycobacterium hackensackense]